MTHPTAAPGRIGSLSPRARLALAAVAGAAAALGLAPFDLWPLGLAGFAGVLLLAGVAPTPRRAALTAWVGATAYFGVALHWIVEPFLVDVARHGWMAPFALVFMAGGLALFWLGPGWIAARAVPDRPGLRVALLAGLVVLAEAARGVVLTGFPWAQPGHVLIGSPLLALSALAGPQGLTLIVMGVAAGIAAALLAGRRVLAGGLLAAPILAALLALAVVPEAPAPGPDAPVVRLVQPNAPQHLKWREDLIPVFFQRALDLTAAAPDGPAPALVLWPETTLPVLLERSDAARARIAEAAQGAQVLLGGQRFEGFRARNTSALLAPDGRIAQVYDKHHLVPFGEYMPGGTAAEALGLRGVAEVLAGGYSPGDGPALIALGGGLGTAFPMICYEAIFPGYIRQVDRPDWMAHLTNDAWFGSFSGPFQHLALARLRAAEQGLPVLRAANTGVSAVIDARGRVVAALPLNTAGQLDARLPPPLPPTVYARTGDWPVLLLAFLATGAALLAGRWRRPLRPKA
ncbi:apolipoprotein N-acyltransferase [Roseicyclus persicicus]|uniref:Apolipoprotein N-acyltransferase n=1 Tax=Roseicyclus persicicus TaxID=2650661 RepID=A0A7X6JW11_9RHOB|nr:apolipoprotein N-acyltransferase [Roseibacterium persicicum]NKX43230.1 apolipoprotein N-acyltransferase [Roseibacterium persicicum]